MRHRWFPLAVWMSMVVVISGVETVLAAELPDVAQEAVSEELLLLKEENVSIAVRREQPISQAPSEVFVITDEDIRQSGAIDIPTILRRIPGMEVMQTTGADFNVSVRGDNQLNANKLLVMVDGRSIYIDVEGFVFWKLLPVTLPEIKRIEVLKGPASAVYGFNAFDGIINIITKSPEEMKGTTIQFGGGEFGTITAAAIQAGTVGNFGYRLSIGEDQNQQWRNRNALAFRAYKFNVQTEYTLSSLSKIGVSGGLVDANRFDGPIILTVSNTATPALGYVHVTYQRPTFQLRAFWNGLHDTTNLITNPVLAQFIRFTTRDGSPEVTIDSNTYNIESQHTLELNNSLELTYGVNYRHNSLSSNGISGFSREDRLGFYVQDEWRPTQTFTAVAGVRYDLDTFINPTVSPRVAVLFTPIPDHTFRATVSVAYRPPTLIETNIENVATTTLPPPLPSPPPLNVRGGPNLGPERIVSYEASYQGWFYKHRLRARTALFFNHISDLIAFTPVPLNDPGYADIYGGEAGVEFLATRWLSGFVNYSYQEISQTFTGDVRRGGPRFKWNLGLRGEWENGLSGEIAYHYYGAVTYPISSAFDTFAPGAVNPRVGSYNLLNLRGAYKFWQQRAAAGYLREAELAVSAFNALNDKHKEHPLGDEIGSRVMGWLTVRF